MILVDFDRTLGYYESWEKSGSALGPPIQPMLARVKLWLEKGEDVRIFTARAALNNPRRDTDIPAIEEWCRKYVGQVLPVQNWKDFTTKEIWDDLAYSVEPNTGRVVAKADPINPGVVGY